LVLAGGYAGWRGSLPSDEVARRLRLSLEYSRRPPGEFAAAMTPSMFAATADRAVVARFAAAVRGAHPAGFRTMARASAEADLRDVLPGIRVPTLVLHGELDARSPLRVAEAMHAAIPGSRLTVLPGVGHVSPVEAPDRFTAAVRGFLASAAGRP
jgi:pimeloyl-ACP methyl ester carboxylesterase